MRIGRILISRYHYPHSYLSRTVETDTFFFRWVYSGRRWQFGLLRHRSNP